jgi:hypothetical protein
MTAPLHCCDSVQRACMHCNSCLQLVPSVLQARMSILNVCRFIIRLQLSLHCHTLIHTLQVPQLVLDHMIESGIGARANMVVTQPRRISALGVAERIAAER